MTIDLTDLQKRAWQTAEAKGWHEKLARNPDGTLHNDSFGSQLNLIHSEAGEGERETAHYKHVDGKPEGIVVEWADVVIRVFDLMGNIGMEAGLLRCVEIDEDDPCLEIRHSIDTVTEHFRENGYNNIGTQDALRDVVGVVFAAAESFGYDQEAFLAIIREKMAYNETRTIRHGDKVV